jgi:hypothetical protein
MLVAIDGLRPGTRDAVRALVPPRSLEVIDEAVDSSWLAVEHHHWVVDGTLKVLGVEQAVASWRTGMRAVFQRPLHKFFVAAAVRLFMNEPGRILQLIPKGWPLAYRDFCTVSYHRTGMQQAEIHFDDIAPQALAFPGYLHSWHAICCAALDLEKAVDGRTSLAIHPSLAAAVVRLTWQAPDRTAERPS